MSGPLFLRRLGRRALVTLFGRARVTGQCLKCGNCCKELVLFLNGDWVVKRDQFDGFVAENPEYGRLYVTGQDDRGFLIFSCSWLTDEGLCRDHEQRLDLCRDHPDETFYTTGGELSPYCGYRVQAPTPATLARRLRRILRRLAGRGGESFDTVLRRARERDGSPSIPTPPESKP